MYDLIYLAFKTDSTQYATYMLQSMIDGPGNMPKNISAYPQVITAWLTAQQFRTKVYGTPV